MRLFPRLTGPFCHDPALDVTAVFDCLGLCYSYRSIPRETLSGQRGTVFKHMCKILHMPGSSLAQVLESTHVLFGIQSVCKMRARRGESQLFSLRAFKWLGQAGCP